MICNDGAGIVARSDGKLGFKVISLDETWTYVGVRRGVARNPHWIWMACWKTHWAIGGTTLRWGTGVTPPSCLRLLERLPDTARCRIDAYGAYGCLPVNKHRIGKGGTANRNEGQCSALGGKLNRLAHRTKGYSKTDGMLISSIALASLKLG